ncbi:MAG: DUF1343 domain-containing protein, partial [Clostridiales bacterium]|nr:DUF1343 domain-containing protein [Clostridiales bacterium]
AAVADEVDSETGAPIYSLFGDIHAPTPEMLDEIDVMVVDLQDVGSRFYTYVYSMCYAIEACARAGKPVVVLDRINPLGGALCQGTLLDERFHSFVGECAVPTRHGLTIGEFARFFVAYKRIDADLTVVPLTGWTRDMYLDDTDAIWTPPSPNMPALMSVLDYPGVCLFEGTNISEGRGTSIPFQIVGAPFIDGARLEKAMRAQKLPGMGFRRAGFTPTFSKFAGEACQGVQMYVTDRRVADPAMAGLVLLETIMNLWPNDARIDRPEHFNHLLGDDAFAAGREDARTLMARHRPLVEDFERRAAAFRLY